MLMEALKTAYAPGFRRLLAVAQGGSIGQVVSIDATFTKLLPPGREHTAPDGGAITELASYALLPFVKLFGTDPLEVRATSLRPSASQVEVFTRIDLRYGGGIGTAKIGIGAKAEGDLVIAGTQGYLYVPAPWWLTDYFELRFEDPGKRERYYVKFAGAGLRYEIGEFASVIRQGGTASYMLRPEESISLARIIDDSRTNGVEFGLQ